jgi:glycosyltransferase involved in cell wall biosynthesis
MVSVIENGVSGYLDTSPQRLIGRMHELLGDPDEARSLGRWARRVARERFGIERFARDWDETFSMVAGRSAGLAAGLAAGRIAS